jgi:predicted lipoprotein with Yx(FWY)xxD motif
MTVIYMVQNDLMPVLQATLTRADGSAYSLTGAAVTFSMEKADGTSVFQKKACTILDAANGMVQYTWSEGDTNVTGLCYGEFEVTFSDGTVLTFPPQNVDLQIFFRPQIA